MPLSLAEFVRRYRNASLTERATAQSHFIDLCDMLGQPHPVASDEAGERYTFEKRVSRTSGGDGFADVWMLDHFAWEYKARGKHKDLKAAYRQLNDYHEDLGNPPLLVVCDFERFEVHTKWTSERTRVYSFTLADLEHNRVTATCPLPPYDVLLALFTNVDRRRHPPPRRTRRHAPARAALVPRPRLHPRHPPNSGCPTSRF